MSLTVRRGFKRRGGACCTASRSQEKCGAQETQGKERPPTRAMRRRGSQIMVFSSFPASGAPTSKELQERKQALGCPAKELPLLTVVYVVTHLEKG